MKQNLIKRKILENDAETEKFSAETGFNKHVSEFLLSYGLSAEDIPDFINPNAKNLLDPFEMRGMDKTVERLKQAAREGQTVVVYGDYDADGICASAILSLYLSQIGVNVYTHIPSRKSGYGLKTESLERIIEESCPDLILTCDCGISACDEVDYVLDLGVDIIVTDHHEVGASVPDCVVINAKQSDCDYPFKQLCGAGVALKVVQAMGGIDEALKYMDIAAIATIADLVPLIGENRLIVQLGLAAMEKSGNLGIRALLDSQKITVPTSTDVAFKIVPRINAAGRMGDAYRAFELLTIDDSVKINEIISDIEQDNTRRRNICDEIYSLALDKIKAEKMLFKHSIVLYSDEWDKGVVGIVAARLTEDFGRPCMLMVKSGDIYKGTARSVEGINIYEVLTSCSDLLTEYGGHNQAAGFSIEKDNIERFIERVDETIAGYDKSLFLPKYYYDIEMTPEELNTEFVCELEKLEPFGNGFNRPTIKLGVEKLKLCQTRSGFYSATIDNGQLISFNPNNINYLVGGEKKYLLIEAELSVYANQQSVRGIIKNVIPDKLYINDVVASANKVYALKNILKGHVAKPKMFAKDKLKEILGEEIYGTVLVASDRTEYENNLFVTEFLPIQEFFGFSFINNLSRFIVSPYKSEQIVFGAKKFVFLSTPPDLRLLPDFSDFDGEIYMCDEAGDYSVYRELSVERTVFAICYEYFRKADNKHYVSSFACFKALNAEEKVSFNQFIFCLCVFEELGLIKINEDGFGLSIQNGKKGMLQTSEIYNFIAKYNNIG